MITKTENIERVQARARKYWAESSSTFMKVVHRTLSTYDDNSMAAALAYVDSMAQPDGDSDEELMEVEVPKKKENKTPEPFDSKTTVGKVNVVVLGRALKHIPPQLWLGFAGWIGKGSLGERIKEAGAKITGWYQVTITSDEVLDKDRANYRVRIVCTWNKEDDVLAVYHAHPDLPSYPDYF